MVTVATNLVLDRNASVMVCGSCGHGGSDFLVVDVINECRVCNRPCDIEAVCVDCWDIIRPARLCGRKHCAMFYIAPRNRYGFHRTIDCPSCVGTAVVPETGDSCDACVCGGCGGMKYYCNGC